VHRPPPKTCKTPRTSPRTGSGHFKLHGPSSKSKWSGPSWLILLPLVAHYFDCQPSCVYLEPPNLQTTYVSHINRNVHTLGRTPHAPFNFAPTQPKIAPQQMFVSKVGHRIAEDSRTMAKMAPRLPQESPKMAPGWPRDDQDGPKMAPRWPQDGPKMVPGWYKMATQNNPR
jgi:hypothetical protein